MLIKAVKFAALGAGILASGLAYAATEPAAAPAASTAPAANTTAMKVGILDMQQIMQSPEAQAIGKKLQAEFQPRQEKITAAQKAYQADVAKLNKDATVMNAADRAKAQDKLIKDRADLQGMMQSFQHDVSSAQNQASQKFMTGLQNAVDAIGKQGGYTLILQRAAVPYSASNMDITKQVIADMAKG